MLCRDLLRAGVSVFKVHISHRTLVLPRPSDINICLAFVSESSRRTQSVEVDCATYGAG